MTDNGDGTYDADYTISEEGYINLSVFLIRGGLLNAVSTNWEQVGF